MDNSKVNDRIGISGSLKRTFPQKAKGITKLCIRNVSIVDHTIEAIIVPGDIVVGVGNKGAIAYLTILIVVKNIGIVRAMLAFLFKEGKSFSARRLKNIYCSISQKTLVVATTESAPVHIVIRRESKPILNQITYS